MTGLNGRLAAKAGVCGALAGKNIGAMPSLLKEGLSQHIRASIDGISGTAGTGAIIRELFRFSRDKTGIGQMSARVARTPDLGQLA